MSKEIEGKLTLEDIAQIAHGADLTMKDSFRTIPWADLPRTMKNSQIQLIKLLLNLDRYLVNDELLLPYAIVQGCKPFLIEDDEG